MPIFILKESFNRNDESYSYGSREICASSKPNAKQHLVKKAQDFFIDRGFSINHKKEHEGVITITAVSNRAVLEDYAFYSLIIEEIPEI